MSLQTAPTRRRGEFVYIDVKAFPLLDVEDRTPATIGPEPADIGQQSWPTEPTLWDIGCQYVKVDLANRVIDFRRPNWNHKNKRRPVAPINDRLLPRLIAAKARHDRDCPLDPFVIGKGCTTYAGCKEDMRAIGIDERGIARHVARHTFCSRRVQLGFSYAHIGKLVGDTSAMIEKVYGHMSPEHLLKASNMDTSMLRVAA